MEDEKSEEEKSRALATSAKKLYGNIQELSVQLENLSSRCLGVEDLFSSDLQTKRLAIKDCCENLFILSPKLYGAVAREKLWRFALYDAVNKARKLQRDREWTPEQLGLVKAHLQGGIGVLQLYIMKLKGLQELEATDPVVIRMESMDKWLDSTLMEDGKKSNITHGDLKRTWVTDLAHLCTINIGDVYRYLKEIHSKAKNPDLMFETAFYVTGAQTHYAQAFLLRPDSGLAFNQLGNLFCDISGSLQSAYYLLYSVQSTNAYEGAYSNLRQLLDRKIVQFARLPASVEQKPIDILVNSVLSLMYYFLYEHTHLANYERHCQDALTNFNERLITCDPEMDEKFMFHLSTICVMIVWRLQTINSVHTSAAVAFAISIFCQLITHLNGILESHASLKQIESLPASPSPPVQSENDQEQVSDVGSLQSIPIRDEDEQDPEKEKESDSSFVIPKRRRRLRRRRGRGDPNGIADDSDSDNHYNFLSSDEEEEESDKSDGDWSSDMDDDDDCDDSIPDDELDNMSQPDGSECSFKIKDRNKAFDCSSSNSNGNSDSSGNLPSRKSEKIQNEIVGVADSEEGEKTKLVIEAEDFSKCQSRCSSLLVALCPIFRWIQSTPVIKDALAANAEKAWLEQLCSTMNMLQDVSKTLAVTEVPEVEIELEEDRSMGGIPGLQSFVKDLQIQSVTDTDSLIIRMRRMVEFGNWIVETHDFSVLLTPEKRFFVPTPQTLKAYLIDARLSRLKDRMKEAKTEEMDKLSKAYNDMKIRVEEENITRRNERNGRRDRRRRPRRDRDDRVRKGATYTVIDLESILNKFQFIKRISANRRFIVAIPDVVMKELDLIKGESVDARVAFHWLEAAFNRKHPGLMVCRTKVKINFPCPKDPESSYFEMMMEYCNFLTIVAKKEPFGSKNRGRHYGDVRDKCRVWFLTGKEDLITNKDKSFDPVKIARNVGIYVDYIGKWKKNG